MPSFISQNRGRLGKRHYIRDATAANHWFDFTERRVNDFRRLFRDQFCLVVNGSSAIDDAYVIPWAVAKGLFRGGEVDDRHRWTGTIVGDRMTVCPHRRTVSVATYRNAFHLL